MLHKARKLRDAVNEDDAIRNDPLLRAAKALLRLAKQSRAVNTPWFLRQRVENGESLPVVQVKDRGPKSEVVEYVVGHMRKERFIELMDMMRRW